MREDRILKGLMVGAVGGLAAAWVMNQFQSGVSALREKLKSDEEESSSQQGEDATQKTAQAIAGKVFHRELAKEEKQRWATVVHYAFGAGVGALYGAMAAKSGAARTGWGTAFGSAVFLLADEAAVPALKLSGPPQKTPLSTHLYAWASHLVFGASLESARRLLEMELSSEETPRRLSQVRAIEHAVRRAA